VLEGKLNEYSSIMKADEGRALNYLALTERTLIAISLLMTNSLKQGPSTWQSTYYNLTVISFSYHLMLYYLAFRFTWKSSITLFLASYHSLH